MKSVSQRLSQRDLEEAIPKIGGFSRQLRDGLNNVSHGLLDEAAAAGNVGSFTKRRIP